MTAGLIMGPASQLIRLNLGLIELSISRLQCRKIRGPSVSRETQRRSTRPLSRGPRVPRPFGPRVAGPGVLLAPVTHKVIHSFIHCDIHRIVHCAR